MEGVYPVDGFIQVEGVPSQLVWDVVDLLVAFARRVCGVAEGGGLAGLKVAVAAGGEDAVEPCLLVLVSGCCEGGSGQLFSIKTVWRFLG
jgi:hypothetical protein